VGINRCRYARIGAGDISKETEIRNVPFAFSLSPLHFPLCIFLIVLAPSGSHRDRTLRIFHEAGVAPDRIEFLPKQPREIYFKSYGRIDISLDTYPYNGHTTSLDSLWMGVPVVTRNETEE
jgi:hypothetical protein